MKKVTMPFGDFDTLILDYGSRLMVRKPEHLMQSLPTNKKQLPQEEDVDSLLVLNSNGTFKETNRKVK